MGDIDAETCQTLTLSGPIEQIRASYTRSTSSVSAIKYYKGSVSKTYGTLISLYREWFFDENNVLLGLHGRVHNNGSKITQLGFITLDPSVTSCSTTETETTSTDTTDSTESTGTTVATDTTENTDSTTTESTETTTTGTNDYET